jgi:hypothetical protein
MTRCWPGTDEADGPAALGEGYQKEPTARRMTHDDLARLFVRVGRVVVNTRQRIREEVSASSNATPCFRAFASALRASQRKRMVTTRQHTI